MKNQIEMQSLQISEEFFKISTVNNMSLPTILVEDATEMTEKPVTNSEGIREPRSKISLHHSEKTIKTDKRS